MLGHVDLSEAVSLSEKDKKICGCIVNFIVIQCIIVFIGGSTVLLCVWSPEHSTHDYDKLIRIMYLYDPQACGYNLRTSRSIWNLQFSNDTHGLNIRPIKWMPAIVTVTTKVSAKTRKYIKLSIAFHVFWLILAIALRLFSSISYLRMLKILLAANFYGTIFMITFDLSMGLLYIAHIQQTLTKGMILRYSGWGVEMKIKRYDDFGGWIPIIAATAFMRGVIILALNIYCCRVLNVIRHRIQKREVKTKIVLEENDPIPEAKYEPLNDKVLYFRSGEYKPVTKKSFRSMFFF